MTLLLLILLVALAAIAFLRPQLGKAAPGLMGGVAVLGVVVVIGSLRGSPDAAYSTKLEVLFEKACGHHFGQCVLSDHPEGGELLLVQHVPAYLGKDAFASQQEGLREGLGGGDWAISLATIDVVDPDSDAGADFNVFDAARFEELLRQHPDVTAVVSLIGFPNCRPGDVKQKLPSLYVLADWGGKSAAWSGAKEVRAIATPKPGGRRPGKKDLDTPLDVLFSQRYDTIR